MSRRARLYLGTAALRAIITAGALILMGAERVELVYPYVDKIMPVGLWAVLWLWVGSVLVIAAIWQSSRMAVAGLISLVTITAVWAIGVTATFAQNPAFGTVSVVLWWTLVAKDLIQIRQPLSSPFEDLAKKYGSG